MTFSFHPYANIFPLIEGDEFLALAEDIRAFGIRDKIDLLGGGGDYQILDGRNRYRSLVWLISTAEPLGGGWGSRAGTPLLPRDLSADGSGLDLFSRFLPDVDGDPLTYVLSKNLQRRHLDESQRASVAADLATLGGGRPSAENRANLPGLSNADAASALNVSERLVKTAKAVKRDAAPEIADAVKQGRLAVSAAAEIAAQPAERQAEILANLPRTADGRLAPDIKKALAPVMKEIRAEKVADKKAKRADREAVQGRKIQALPDNVFGVAIEDFEWDHEPWSRETGIERHPSMHYETAADAHTPEEIVARCAERFKCLADDCILFKWTTTPHLAIAIKVLELQGFKYVTSLAWNKLRNGNGRGPGYWFTGEHELVLVGVRGNVVAPYPAHFRSSFSTPAGEHSEKPDNIHEIIEFHWPTTPKVEFNARRRRDGWQAWGFDAEEIAPPTSDVNVLTAETASEEIKPPASVADAPAPQAVIEHVTPAPPAIAGDPLELPDFLRRVPLSQHEMDLTRRDRLPPEVVDETLQTRLPLTDDEIELQAALLAIVAGETLDWSITRSLVGAGFVHATTEKLIVTDEGRAFLAQIVRAPASMSVEARA